MFSNDVVGETIYTDKTALEDAIQFQYIDFEMLDGHYFNQGQNDKIKQMSFSQKNRFSQTNKSRIRILKVLFHIVAK